MKNSAIKRLIIYSLFIIAIGGGLTLEANNANAQEAKVQVIRNLDEPALNPYQQTGNQTCTLGGNCAFNFPAVQSLSLLTTVNWGATQRERLEKKDENFSNIRDFPNNEPLVEGSSRTDAC